MFIVNPMLMGAQKLGMPEVVLASYYNDFTSYDHSAPLSDLRTNDFVVVLQQNGLRSVGDVTASGLSFTKYSDGLPFMGVSSAQWLGAAGSTTLDIQDSTAAGVFVVRNASAVSRGVALNSSALSINYDVNLSPTIKNQLLIALGYTEGGYTIPGLTASVVSADPSVYDLAQYNFSEGDGVRQLEVAEIVIAQTAGSPKLRWRTTHGISTEIGIAVARLDGMN